MKTIKAFHPIVNFLLLGTIMSRAATFMAMPFLAIYLSRTTAFNPILIGLIIGIAPLTSTVGGFIGGTLSDMFGRKGIMLTALFIWVLVFIGFGTAHHPLTFLILNSINGLSRSFFEPSSQALMVDLTSKELRIRMFSYRYTAINIGASVGPLLGAYFGAISANFAFFITALVYFIYFLAVIILFMNYKINSRDASVEKTTFRRALKVIITDKAFSYFLIAGILVNIGYAQIESTLPQYLKVVIPNGVILYSVLLSFNAVTVVLLQFIMIRIIEKLPLLRVLIIGATLFALGHLIFSIVHTWSGFILGMLFITVGEIFIFPMGGVIIDKLASDELRGTYFGANGFRSIGFFLGPWLGGLLLVHFNGSILFIIMSVVTLSSIIMYTLGYRQIRKREVREQVNKLAGSI